MGEVDARSKCRVQKELCGTLFDQLHDISVIVDRVSRGLSHEQTMRDMATVIRYGPKRIEDIAIRRLTSSGHATWLPTEMTQQVLELYLHLNRRRWRVNRERRIDGGEKQSE